MASNATFIIENVKFEMKKTKKNKKKAKPEKEKQEEAHLRKKIEIGKNNEKKHRMSRKRKKNIYKYSLCLVLHCLSDSRFSFSRPLFPFIPSPPPFFPFRRRDFLSNRRKISKTQSAIYLLIRLFYRTERKFVSVRLHRQPSFYSKRLKIHSSQAK